MNAREKVLRLENAHQRENRGWFIVYIGSTPIGLAESEQEAWEDALKVLTRWPNYVADQEAKRKKS